MSALEHNIESLKLSIQHACKLANRPEESVYLLPVSKTRPASVLKLAYDLGFHQFGENYLSEAAEKVTELSTLSPPISWHFIGPIQSNKTRAIAEQFSWVQTLDRAKIIRRLNEQRPTHLPPLNCLIQINISDDSNKSGAKPEDAAELAELIEQCANLSFRGLMAIPKKHDDPSLLAQDFSSMKQLFDKLKAHYPQCDTLSMGMSGDLALAIAHGATMVRIGTDFFGKRT